MLADAMWYTQDRFKPRFMIDLATLTGAILIALGQEYAGMFANDNKLADQLTEIGNAEGEKVWRECVKTWKETCRKSAEAFKRYEEVRARGRKRSMVG